MSFCVFYQIIETSVFKPVGIKNVKAKGLCHSFQVNLFCSGKEITDYWQLLPWHFETCQWYKHIYSSVLSKYSSCHHFKSTLVTSGLRNPDSSDKNTVTTKQVFLSGTDKLKDAFFTKKKKKMFTGLHFVFFSDQN